MWMRFQEMEISKLLHGVERIDTGDPLDKVEVEPWIELIVTAIPAKLTESEDRRIKKT
jgi:hypothetical protein